MAKKSFKQAVEETYKKEYKKTLNIIFRYSELIGMLGVVMVFLSLIKMGNIGGLIVGVALIIVSWFIIRKSLKKIGEEKDEKK